MMRVLVTGATGFVGPAILDALKKAGHRPIAATRRPEILAPGIEARLSPDFLDVRDDQARALVAGCDALIHAAGHAHADDQDEGVHQAINARAPATLARAAAEAGIPMVHLSSIKALGPADPQGFLREDREPCPEDFYGKAKLAGEEAVAAALPGRHVVLRPTLVAGPGAKGNLASLLAIARLPVPLPFAGLEAPRSLISRQDLAGLCVRALSEPGWRGMRMIAADPEAVTVAGMIASIRRGLGRPSGLFPVPEGLLRLALPRLAGPERAGRLLTPLVAEPSFLLRQGWQPRQRVPEALEEMAREAAD